MDGRSPRSILNASAWVALALWLLPVTEALSSAGGNLAALGRFFVTSGGTGHGMTEALFNWSYGLVGLLRSDFGLPWGGHVVLRGFWWVVPCALGQVLLLFAVARRDFRSGRSFDGALALSAAAASGVGLWATTRIEGEILDHEIFWLAALGALNLAILGAAGLRSLAGTWPAQSSLGRQAANTGCVLLLILITALGVRHLRDLTAFELRRTDRPTILATHVTIREYLRGQGIREPLVEIEGRAWSHAAGVVLRLLQDGTPFAMPDVSLPMFTGYFKANGDEEAIVTISSDRRFHEEMSARPGNAVLRDAHSIYVDAVRIVPAGRGQTR